jgi:hypothetical protein
LGRTGETVDEMLGMLPDPILRGYIGRFPVNHKHDTEQQILESAESLWQARERFETEKLLEQIFDAAKSNMRGVLGVPGTLAAVTEEKVQTLVVAEGAPVDGWCVSAAAILPQSRSEVARSAVLRRSTGILPIAP